MIICQCAKRVCNKHGPCDVQNAVDKANAHRQNSGRPPLTNTKADVKTALNAFYADHKVDADRIPCGGCAPFVRQEIEDILAGGQCNGGTRGEKHV